MPVSLSLHLSRTLGGGGEGGGVNIWSGEGVSEGNGILVYIQ